MTFSGWTAASASLFAAPYLGWMIYARLFARYRYAFFSVVFYMLTDIYLNVCWNSDSQYCPTGSSESAEVARTLSDLGQFMALTALFPLIDEWCISRLPTKWKDEIGAAFYVLYASLTTVMVIHFGHDLPTSITLPSLMAVAVIYAYACEMMDGSRVRDLFLIFRFWLGVALFAVGVMLEAMGNRHEWDASLTLQTDAYNQYMFGARAAYGVGVAVAITCVGNAPNLKDYMGVPTKQPSGPNAPSAKKLVTYG